MSLRKTQWWIIGIAVAALVVIVILGFVIGLKRAARQEIALNFWGMDSPLIWTNIIKDYNELHPEVKIKYSQLPTDSYEEDLLNGLASTNRPDVFMFFHRWLPKHVDKIVPASKEVINIEKFRSIFPTVVEQDFAPDGQIYALPLYLDTLSLFYNRDIFDRKGIALPPSNWIGFQEIAKKLGFGATAIGGSADSIDRAPDLLSLLMLQDGVEMTDPNFTRATFSRGGLDSLLFYTKFSNPESEYYIWNDKQPYSVDGFIEGKVGMMFGYRYHARYISEMNPQLPFEMVSTPQSGIGKVNYPFYFGLAASANSPHNKEAWDFIVFAATQPEISKKYLAFVQEPPALRTLIAQVGNTEALAARSWLQIDDIAIDNIFSEMIKSVLNGFSPDSALRRAEELVNQIFNKKR